jgi:Deoxyribonuclease NucA/NucB
MKRAAQTLAAALVAATALLAVTLLTGQAVPVVAGERVAHATPTCSDYPNQKAAQEAADTRDGDGDGIYCEELPCPCSTEAGGGDHDRGAGRNPEECTKPRRIQRLVFSKSEYPNIRRHFRGALRRGWPRRLVLNRRGADERRDRLLEDIPTKDGYDRDEYPPAVGRGKGEGLERGRNPRGWKAHVRYVPSSENRSHGATLGAKLADFCNGTRFRYVFR